MTWHEGPFTSSACTSLTTQSLPPQRLETLARHHRTCFKHFGVSAGRSSPRPPCHQLGRTDSRSCWRHLLSPPWDPPGTCWALDTRRSSYGQVWQLSPPASSSPSSSFCAPRVTGESQGNTLLAPSRFFRKTCHTQVPLCGHPQRPSLQGVTCPVLSVQ